MTVAGNGSGDSGAATTVVTTRWRDGAETSWLEGTELFDRRSMPTWQFPFRFAARALRADAAIVIGSLGFSARYLDHLGGIALKALPRKRRPVLVVTEATWEQQSRALAAYGLGWLAPFAAKLFIRALDGPHVAYCVLSEEERRSFPSLWGMAQERVAVTLYHVTRPEHVLARPSVDDGYLFAGGDPLRDYPLLIEATKVLDVPLRIASRKFRTPSRPGLEVGPVDPEAFRVLEGNAKAIVVPMQTDTIRSAGHQTYLNALARGKPLIVTDAPGVRDYIVADRHALIVRPRVEELRAAIEYVFDPGNADAVAAMAQRGQDWALEHFPFSRYRERVVEITEAAVRSYRNGRMDLGPIAPETP
jgi:Glycosyl transferases group 1